MAVINTINETPDVSPKTLADLEPNSFFIVANEPDTALFFKPKQFLVRDGCWIININIMESRLMPTTIPIIPVVITNTPEIKYKEII